MSCPSFLLLFLILLFFNGEAAVMPVNSGTLEHIDPTLPSARAGQEPKCSVLVLRQEFANTLGHPPATANFSQPEDCPHPWSRVVLELSVSATDVQKGRMAAVWIDGAEILRMSTPVPMAPGAYWRVEKDVTRYESLLLRLSSGNGGALSMMLENSNKTLPGVYHANVTLHFYRGVFADARQGYTAHPSVKGLYTQPANLIYPISQDCYGNGFWFRINNESHVPVSSIAIPRNTYRAVLEIFASHHSDDEFWYTKPFRSTYSQNKAGNHMTTIKGNGAFRQLYATIDGKFVGGHIPFAVIYPGAINPYFWSPVAAIGAFDIPSYDLDITPFLGMLLDGQLHEVGLGVREATAHWLVSANLHLWIDPVSDTVESGLSVYRAPRLKIHRHAEWHDENGSSDVSTDGIVRFAGWVVSSKGNLTTTVRMKVRFRSKVEVHDHGAAKTVEMIHKSRTTVGVRRGVKSMGHSDMFVEAPLHLQSMSAPAPAGGVIEKTRLTHQLKEWVYVDNKEMTGTSAVTDRQEVEGSALLHGGEPVWGSGSMKSSYKYRDAKECHIRVVNTEAGVVKFDATSRSCSAVADV
ncbi:putative peptide-N(4)-(N-acetyl-beta-glucosaminyl)asparagine amidase [Dioscorea sansibarensis]